MSSKSITRRIYVALGVLSLFILVSLFLGRYIVNGHLNDMYRLKASILSVVIEKGLDVEEDVLEAFNNLERYDTALGENSLSRIGITEESMFNNYYFKDLRKNISFSISIIAFTMFLIFFTHNYVENKRNKIILQDLVQYLEDANNGNFSLDIRDNQEGMVSILKNSIYNITNTLKEHNNELQRERNQLSKAISDISHQIKTPLTSIQVMLDVIRKSNLSKDKEVEFYRVIQNQIYRLNWLVSSLLKLAKIDAKTVILKKEKVSGRELINKVLQPFSIPLEIKEIEFEIVGEDVYYLGDMEWSIEAFNNIIKNCIEHTDKRGKIEIQLNENALFTEISIKDTGKGIAKEDLPYIFNRFYRGENAAKESVGIGLALTKSIVENQGGYIDVISEQNKGTTFKTKFYKTIV